MVEKPNVVSYKLDSGQELELSIEIVRKYLLSEEAILATDQEISNFIALCAFQKLNPFLKEAYLLKAGSEPAIIVIGKDVFTKRASQDERCQGWEAGVIVRKDADFIYRTGSFTAPEEELLGGWATVYRSDWEKPISTSVALWEYQRLGRDGLPTGSWETMPATMIRKVAMVQALREALPDKFQGMYSQEEMPVFPSSFTVNPKEDSKQCIEQQNEIDWREAYIQTASKYGLSQEELKVLAERTGKAQWEKLQKRTFRSLVTRFEADGKKAADDAKVWLSKTRN